MYVDVITNPRPNPHDDVIKQNIFRLTGPLRGDPPITGGFPSQRPVNGAFDVFLDLRLDKRLSKQSRRRWFGMSSRSLWRHCNVMFITRVSEVIMFSPCVFVCLSRCLSGRFNYEGLVPHKQYFPGTLLGMSSCASYISRTHDVIDDVTRSQSRSNFESDIYPSIFELERWSKAQNVGNAHGYLSGLFNFRYNFR